MRLHTPSQKPLAIFLMGPTAAGKTDLAIEVAQHFPAEIISVDSAMVYRGMDIGTGKPTIKERRQIPHHLIDIRDPTEVYSAAEFCKDALHCMREITEKEKVPILVGGTSLYFRALLQGLSPLPKASPSFRAHLEQEAEKIGWQQMHARLQAIDPLAASRIHPKDPQRISRALEVYEITKQPLSSLQQTQPGILQSELQQYQIHSFALIPEERKHLHDRIAVRFHKMLEQGFIEEVQQLRKREDLHLNLPAMRAVGYRQIWEYLDNLFSYDVMVERAIAATRQLAKRQLTWLRNSKKIDSLISQENARKVATPQITPLIIENSYSDLLKTMLHSLF